GGGEGAGGSITAVKNPAATGEMLPIRTSPAGGSARYSMFFTACRKSSKTAVPPSSSARPPSEYGGRAVSCGAQDDHRTACRHLYGFDITLSKRNIMRNSCTGLSLADACQIAARLEAARAEETAMELTRRQFLRHVAAT